MFNGHSILRERTRRYIDYGILDFEVPAKCGSRPFEEFAGIGPLPSAPVNFVSRIVGGRNSEPGGQPWQVSLKRGSAHFCGGTIIDTRWVLTAAHCIPPRDRNFEKTLSVVVGEYDMETSDDEEQTLRVSRVIVHPKFRPLNPVNNDVALLELTKDIVYGVMVQPACLPYQDEEFLAGTLCTVSGWGKMQEEGQMPSILQEVSLPLLDPELCARVLAAMHLPAMDRTMLCAGFPNGGRDACQGDSGGPLVCQRPSGAWSCTAWSRGGSGALGAGPGSRAAWPPCHRTCRRACSAARRCGPTRGRGRRACACWATTRAAPSSSTRSGCSRPPTASESNGRCASVGGTRRRSESAVGVSRPVPRALQRNHGGLRRGARATRVAGAAGRRGAARVPTGGGAGRGAVVRVRRHGLGRARPRYGEPAERLQQLQVPVLDSALCEREHYPRHPGGISARMLCAGFPSTSNKDTCQGDSGGPLVCSLTNGSMAVFGLTSWGEDCGKQGRPGVYTRIASLLPWIQAVLTPAGGGRRLLGATGQCLLPAPIGTAPREPGQVTSESNRCLPPPPLVFSLTSTRLEPPLLAPWCRTASCGAPVIRGLHGTAAAAGSARVLVDPLLGLSRVVGGTEAAQRAWPWQGSVQYGQGGHYCGATLIHPHWAITAAHCDVSAASDTLVLGLNDLRERGGDGQRLQVARVVTHPGYGGMPPQNDLALLQLATPAHIDEVYPDQLQQATLPLIGNEECRKRWGLEAVVTAENVCAGAAGASSCLGDSGGPLVCHRGGLHVLVGVVSWGSETCQPNVPSVYTNIASHTAWIAEMTGGVV
ncbi:unnamed protein product [Lampetra fluviatilis]